MKNENINGEEKGSKYFTDLVPRDKNGNILPGPVAMTAACVAHYRRKLMPIKTIYLKKAHYLQFVDWTKKMLSEEDAEKYVECYTFDGVEIRQMGALKAMLSNENMTWDFYPQTIKIDPKTVN